MRQFYRCNITKKGCQNLKKKIVRDSTWLLWKKIVRESLIAVTFFASQILMCRLSGFVLIGFLSFGGRRFFVFKNIYNCLQLLARKKQLVIFL
jgi:hypothetical protein